MKKSESGMLDNAEALKKIEIRKLGRVRLGTRLQFLVAQTDVSGIWAVSRRHRLWVYAAGMAIDMTAAAVALVVMAVLRSSGVAVPFAFPMIVLTVATVAPLQFLVFMRIDVYFILQDLAGCRNLYSDGAAYLRHLASRLPHTRSERVGDPTRTHPRRERIAVRCYALLLALGTLGCLVAAATITLPFTTVLLTGAARTAFSGGSAAATLDAAVTGFIVVAFQMVWAFAW